MPIDWTALEKAKREHKPKSTAPLRAVPGLKGFIPNNWHPGPWQAELEACAMERARLKAELKELDVRTYRAAVIGRQGGAPLRLVAEHAGMASAQTVKIFLERMKDTPLPLTENVKLRSFKEIYDSQHVDK